MIPIPMTDVESMNEERLQSFLNKKYRENRFLDYKLKYEKRSVDEARLEFLADVTGFANYQGGAIIIGVSELEEEGQSALPGVLEGIEKGEVEAEIFRNLCDTSIDPPIRGLIVKEIPLSNGKAALVAHVPLSLRRPHMVTFRGKNRFHIRHDDRTVKMTTDEVKRTVIEVINLQNDMDKYVSMVEEEIGEDYVGNDFCLLMHAVPVRS